MRNGWAMLVVVTLAGWGICSDWSDRAKAENSSEKSSARAKDVGVQASFPEDRSHRNERPNLDGLIAVETLRAGSTLVSMEVVNQSPRELDLSGLVIGVTDGTPLSSSLRVVRGSLSLSTGDRALIVTSPQVDLYDLARIRYDNLYVADALAGEVIVFSAKGIALVAPGGTIVDVIDPQATTTPGQCCNKAQGGFDCNNSCGGFCGFEDRCTLNVTKNFCCGQLFGCCWEAEEVFCYAQGYCTGADHQCCN